MSRVFLILFLCAVSACAEPVEPLLPEPSPADRLLSSGKADAAMNSARLNLRSDPNRAQDWNLLCRANLLLERWDPAINACEKAVSLEPKVSSHHLWLGRAYGLKAEHVIFLTAIGLAKKVRSEFERAVELDPANVAAQSDLAEFFIEAPAFLGGGLDKAQIAASRLNQAEPSTAHWIRSRIAEKQKQNAQAERELQMAIDSARDRAPYWLNLASFYRRVGRLDDMQQAIQRAVSSRNDPNDILFEAAQLLIRAGRDLPHAAEWLRSYLLSPDPVEAAPLFQAHYLLGSISEKQGQTEAAAAEYRAALALASEFEPAQQALRRLAKQ